MKKIISISLVLMLLLGILAVPALAEEVKIKKVGVLGMLRIDEGKMKDILLARRIMRELSIKSGEGDKKPEPNPDSKPVPNPDHERGKTTAYEVTYFDSLDEMIMALNAGKIDNIEINETTAKYLCANNDELVYLQSEQTDMPAALSALVFNGILVNDFSFMLTEGNEALRDEFNTAIAAIREDGTMEKLIAEYIDGVNEGKDIPPIEIAKIDGAETIKVAVTGDLPPMDYIAPDGTPAGFNTALLAEISKRIGKNIELRQIASPARSTALASGSVDVVFWMRTSSSAKQRMGMSEEEKKADREKRNAGMTEEQLALMESAAKLISAEEFLTADLPDGTITTDPYFSDTLVTVHKKPKTE